jgi:hypothetical protein
MAGVRANQSEVIRLAPLDQQAAATAHANIPGPTALGALALLPAVGMLAIRRRRKGPGDRGEVGPRSTGLGGWVRRRE